MGLECQPVTQDSTWQVTDEDGSGMDNQSLRDELMTFLVAVPNLNSCAPGLDLVEDITCASRTGFPELYPENTVYYMISSFLCE